MTLMLLGQTVNSCKVRKDQTVSSQITAGTQFVFMTRMQHFHTSGKEAQAHKHEVLCVCEHT
jgi:hypothetical protein